MSIALDQVLEAVPVPRSGVLCRQIDDEGVLYDVAQHTVHYLNETALCIWTLSDGVHSVRDITDELRRRFQGPSEASGSLHDFADDVLATLTTFRENGLISLEQLATSA